MARKPITTGKTVTVRYPDSVHVDDIGAERKKRRITVKAVRDLLVAPLTPDEFEAEPYALYSRTIVHAFDHLLDCCRDIYLGLTAEYRSPAALLVGTFDTHTGELLRLFDREYQPTKVDRDIMVARMPMWESALVAGERLGIFAPDMRVVGGRNQ